MTQVRWAHPLSRCELSVKMQVQGSSDLPHNRCPVTPLTLSVTCDLSQPAHLAICNSALSCLLSVSPTTLIFSFASHYSQSRKASLVTFMSTQINTCVQVALRRTLVCLKVQVPSYDPLHPISIGLLTCDPSVRGFIFAYIYISFARTGKMAVLCPDKGSL